MPSTFTFRFFAAILLMGHLFSLSAWAQSGRPTIDDIDILCNDSFEMPPPPPPIILSGATCHVTFKNDDPILEGAGRSKELHYGALSDGPVTMTFSNRTAPWVVEVRDEEGGLLLRSSGDGKGEGKSISVDLSAGDAIRITVALADEGTRGKLRFILKETNIEEGNERLDEARRETGRFRSLFLEALEAGDRTAASDAMRKGIEAARSYRGYRWDHKLIGFLAWIRGYDLVKNDPVAWLKTTEPVVDYLEIKFNPGDKRLLAFRRELAEAFSLNGQRERCLEQAELAWRITELAFREERETIFKARCDYALALGDVGCHYDSYTIHERVLKEFGHILAGDALDEAQFRLNYSACMWAVGDLYGSRHEIEAALAILEQKVDSKNLNLLKVRLHHATVLYSMGELLSAKTAAEKALATAEEILGATHLLLQECRQTLAIILTETGDLARARPLQENALKEVLAHHAGNTFQVQRAQIHLAGILLDSGDLDGARELAEQAMAIAETVRRKNDQNAQNAMGLLARIFFSLGEYEAARGMWGNLCEIWRDKWLSKSRLQFYSLANMALCEHHLGDTKAARLKLEETFSEFDRRSALSESDVFWYRANLAQMLADSGDKRGAVENVRLAMDGFRKFMARQMRSGAVREIEEATVAFGYIPDLFLSLVGGTPAFERESFKAVELCRSAGRRVAHARRKIPADGSEKIAALQYAYSRANCRVSEAGGDDLVAAIGKREIAERALASAREGLRAAAGLGRDVSADEVIAALGEGCAGVTIVRYGRRIPGNRAGEISLEKGMPSYLAFIIKKPNTICRIDLGPAEPIDGAVKEWRDSLCHKPASAAEGASARRAARELIRLVWKPIVGAVGEAKRLVIAPDALLATIPLDALPHDSGIALDTYKVSYIDSLSDLVLSTDGHGTRGDCLVMLGDVAYNEAPRRFGAQASTDRTVEADPESFEFDVRIVPQFGSAGLTPLPGTAKEIGAVSRQFVELVGGKSIVVKGAEASKTSLFALAPKAGYLHLATHGYFAPEIVRSKTDDPPLLKERLFSTWHEKVEGLAPSLLSGLLLAGSGLPADNKGRRGILTAEEMQGLDLALCKLVVLSACESNVGLARAGRGIMSMQRALSIAGARGSITSLWKVDDEAARAFFTHFYGYLWRDGLDPAAALRRVKLDMASGKITPTKGSVPRGPPKPRPRDVSRPHDYSHPFYWAAFVYWGSDI